MLRCTRISRLFNASLCSRHQSAIATTIADNHDNGPLNTSDSHTRSNTPTLYSQTQGGYTGKLTQAYLSTNRQKAFKALFSRMHTHNQSISNPLTLNYLLDYLLNTKLEGDGDGVMGMDAIVGVLERLEAVGGVDLFTFEILLGRLGGMRRCALLVEEIFQMMGSNAIVTEPPSSPQTRVYAHIKPSNSCWVSRIQSWLNSSNSLRAALLYNQWIADNSSAHVDVVKECRYLMVVMAVRRRAWPFISHVLQQQQNTEKLTGAESAGEISQSLHHHQNSLFSHKQAQALLKTLLHTQSHQSIPLLHHLLTHHPLHASTTTPNNCVATRLMYYAHKHGYACWWIAMHAFRTLCVTSSNSENKNGDSIDNGSTVEKWAVDMLIRTMERESLECVERICESVGGGIRLPTLAALQIVEALKQHSTNNAPAALDNVNGRLCN